MSILSILEWDKCKWPHFPILDKESLPFDVLRPFVFQQMYVWNIQVVAVGEMGAWDIGDNKDASDESNIYVTWIYF